EGVEGEMSDDDNTGMAYILPSEPRPEQWGAVRLPNKQWKWPTNAALRAWKTSWDRWRAAHNRFVAQHQHRRPVGRGPRHIKVVKSLGSHEHERHARIDAQTRLNACAHKSYQRRLVIHNLRGQIANLQAKLTWCTTALSACKAQGATLDSSMFQPPPATLPGVGPLPDVSYDPTVMDNG